MPESTARPLPAEYAPYAAKYIALVPDGDIIATLARQMETTLAEFGEIPEERSLYRYAPGKWSLREVLGHIVDTERILAYRALRIARGDQTPLPGFDQDAFIATAHFDRCSMSELLGAYTIVRQSTLLLLSSLSDKNWGRLGTASGNPLSVRAAAWMMAGHELHHLAVVQNLYLR